MNWKKKKMSKRENEIFRFGIFYGWCIGGTVIAIVFAIVRNL